MPELAYNRIANHLNTKASSAVVNDKGETYTQTELNNRLIIKQASITTASSLTVRCILAAGNKSIPMVN